MKVIHQIISIVMLSFAFPAPANVAADFDDAIKELQQTKPELFEDPVIYKAKSSKKDDTSYDSLDRIIDIIALFSAFTRICCRYQALTAQTKTSNIVHKILNYAVPAWLTPLGYQAILVKDATMITLETIVYKTVAKLLVYCAKGDAYDLTIKILDKIKTLAIG